MLTAIVGLLGALVYGAADFLGGLAARRLRSVVVTAIAGATGLTLFLLASPIFGGTWTWHDAVWGAISGVFGAVSVVLLYACLAIGPMSILSPLTALASAIAPMIWGLTVNGEGMTGFGLAGLGIALIAVVLVGFVPGEGAVRPSSRGLIMAVGAGLAIGAFLIAMDQTSPDSGLLPLVTGRAANVAIMGSAILILALWNRGSGRDFLSPASGLPLGATPTGHADLADAARPISLKPDLRTGILIALACGVLDALANALLLLGLRLGELAVMSVLTAMYPAGTIILAALVLRERIAAVQWIGLGLALVAAGLFALA